MPAFAPRQTRRDTRRRSSAGARSRRSEPSGARYREHGDDRADDFRLPDVRRGMPRLLAAFRRQPGVADDLHGRRAARHCGLAAGSSRLDGRALALPRDRTARGRGLKGGRRCVRQRRGPTAPPEPGGEQDNHRGQGWLRARQPHRPGAELSPAPPACRTGAPPPHAARPGPAIDPAPPHHRRGKQMHLPPAPAFRGTPARGVVRGVADWGFGHAHPFTPARRGRSRGGGRLRAC